MLWLIVAAVALVASCVAMNKCCRAGDVVQVDSFDDGNLSPGGQFICVDPLTVANRRDSEGLSSNKLTKPHEMIAYNIRIDENSHWPTCIDNSHFSSSHLNESASLGESASCVDIMDGLYFIFSCKERLQSADDLVDLHKLRKCCEKNHSYDVFMRRCVSRNNLTSLNEDFGQFLGADSFVFESGLPQCKPDDVLVEYHSLVHNLKVLGSSLIVSQSPGQDVVPQDSFCIERALNSEVSLPEGADPTQHELKATSKWIAKACRPRTVCDRIPCVRKCCEEGQRMVQEKRKKFCEAHDSHLSLKFHLFEMQKSRKRPRPMEPTEYGLLKPKHCDDDPLEEETHGKYYHSGVDGSLYLNNTNEFHSNEDYCIDYFYYKGETADKIMTVTFVCYSDDDNTETTEKRTRLRIYAPLLATSAAFLAVTFVVYILLPKLLNLHGKTLVCYVLSLFVAYSVLSAVQFSTKVHMTHCKIVGFVIYVSFLSAFSWLNVMCIDIFWTFGSARNLREVRRKKELKRFICYSIYAWGFPCLATVVCFMTDSYKLLPTQYSPNIGVYSCWFDTHSSGIVIFFLVPVGFQICINTVLFVITAIHCSRIKSEIQRMQLDDNCEQKKKPFLADKAILLTNLKLFIVMGVSWLLEILTTIIDERSMLSLWIISDLFNLLQGVFIFFIFVFKRRVLTAFQQKLGICSKKLRSNQHGPASSTFRSTLGFHPSPGTHSTRLTMTNINMSLR